MAATTRLRYVADVNPPIRRDLFERSELEISFLPMEAIGETGAVDLSRTRTVGEVRNGYSYFEDGDLAFAKVTPCFENGKGALFRGLLGGVGFGTTELTVLRPRAGISARFINYVIRGEQFREQGRASMTGAGGLKRIPDEFTRDFKFWLPASSEQERIADFLDDKTARIDALISAKKKSISTLQDYVTSYIDLVVTGRSTFQQGPEASRNGLLETLPAGWTVKRLKHISPQVVVGIVVNPSDYYVDEGAPFVFGGDIDQDGVRVDTTRRISEQGNAQNSKSRLRTGDLLTVRVGEPGLTAVVPPALNGANCASVMLVRGDPSFDSYWLAACMNASIGRDQVRLVEYGAAMKQFNISHAREFRYPIPSLEIQSTLARDILEVRTRVKGLIASALTSVMHLNEYRSSLISAAVSGQISIS